MPTKTLSFWLMIVSTAMAVLADDRSPMITSRWPRRLAKSRSGTAIRQWIAIVPIIASPTKSV